MFSFVDVVDVVVVAVVVFVVAVVDVRLEGQHFELELGEGLWMIGCWLGGIEA